ncbi:efflux RND transporter permease subunit [Zhongshania sp. BJYM1]|uniref:efflux RND transporter permease subunit n=1 Tax=Zhongshania aquatica TaxID=2965069 RepID=UPI0022B36C55|nr:efflux RND transporter permease subunit [Marortus sp. BJYM1]
MLEALIKRHKIILLIFALLVIFFGWHSRSFEINASTDTLISENNLEFIKSQKVNQAFSPEEFLIIAYHPKDGDIFSAKSQANISEISQKIKRLNRVKSVRSVMNVPLLSKASQGLSTEMNPSDFTQENLQLSASELRRIFKDHPIYDGLLINHEQTASGIQVLFKTSIFLQNIDADILAIQSKLLDGPLSNEDKETLNELKAKAAPLEKRLRETRNKEIEQLRKITNDYSDEADLYLGGAHVLGYQLINIIQHDLAVFGSAIGLAICLLIFAVFRRISWVIITITCCASCLFITIGAFGLIGLKATVISSNFISLQLILSLAIVIHLIVQYREDIQNNPEMSQQELVLLTLKSKIAPCFFAGFTTSFGFASLLLSEIEPVKAFGLMMIIAMAVSILCTLLLFPALLLLFSREESPSNNFILLKPVHWVQRTCIRNSSAIMAFSAVFFIASIFGSLRLDVENSFINYFASDTEVHKELSFIDKEFGGSTPLDIIYTPPEAPTPYNNLVLHARDIHNVQRIQKALGEFEAMGTRLSVFNFTQLAKQINNNKPLTEYELTAIYWTLDKSIREDLLNSFLIEPPTQLRISARIKDSTKNLDRGAMLAEINKKIQDLGIPAENYQLSNLFVLYQAMLEQLFTSQILTLGAVFIALGIAFFLIFKSAKIAVIAIIPNIISAIAILGVMGWCDIPLDFMTMTIAAIAMGIAVDDTIHYIHRYLLELKTNTAEKAVERSHQSVGYALIYTSIIIAIGFALLGFSDFVPSVLFGLLTGLAIIIALVADMTLLPVLLHKFVRGNVRDNTTDTPDEVTN